jgi:Zn-dependent protease with chaperone function
MRASNTASLIPAPLVVREQQHRRHVLIGLATLLVLSISPVFGHHLVGAADWLPVSLQHLGPFCMVALHHLLAPVHGAFHLMLWAGLAFTLIDRTRAASRHARTMRALSVTPATANAALTAATEAIGFDVRRVHLVGGSPNPAFTSGWWTPRIYVSQELPSQLSVAELEAVLLHEVAHVRRRDPLRQFAWRTLAGVLFWLPALRRLADELADEAEIVADDFAARTRALPLASAILRMAGADVGTLEIAVGFQRRDLLERRVRRLAGEDAAVSFQVPRRSIVGAALVLLAVWTSGVIVLHPLPADDHVSGHCAHVGAWQLSHLFCTEKHTFGERCPHQDALVRDAAAP